MKKARRRRVGGKRRTTHKRVPKPQAQRTRQRPTRNPVEAPTDRNQLAAGKLHLLRDFRYIHLSTIDQRLSGLNKAPNGLLVIGDGEKESMKFYLSSLALIRKSLKGAQKGMPDSAPPSAAKVRTALKAVGVELPGLKHSQCETGFAKLISGKMAGPGFVNLKNGKATTLVLSADKAKQRTLPLDVKRIVSRFIARQSAKPLYRPEKISTRNASHASPTDKKLKGIVKWFDNTKGYGFIRPNRGNDVYVHFSAIRSDGFMPLKTGQKVTFSVEAGSPGQPKAKDVEVAGSRPRRTNLPSAGATGGSQRWHGWAHAKPPLHPDEPDGGGVGGPSPPLNIPVYADIYVPDPHPVQGSEFELSVSLDFRPSETTSSTATAPEDDKAHIFDVHLQLGRFSSWGKLTFRRPAGTTEKAAFSRVKAPILTGTEEKIDGHPVADIYVNFYLENRWCGEALRRIEILPGEHSDRLAAIETPEAPPWRRDLCVVPGTEPPDLLIRIKKASALEYEWSLFSPFMDFSRSSADMTMSLVDPPYTFVKKKFEVFSAAELTDAQVDDLNATCDVIFETAPQGFREAYRRMAAAAAIDPRISFKTIQIVSDEPFIPWELMRVSDVATPPAFSAELLCVKHSVGRWLASDSARLGNRLHVDNIAVAASDYKSNALGLSELPWAVVERTFLTGAPYEAEEIPLQLAKLVDFFHTGSAEVVHFSCHGGTDVQVPDDATLYVEDDQKGLKASLVSAVETRTGLGKHHPIVFLNACQAAASGTFLGILFGWPQAFLRMGATACVAPFWKVVDSKAMEIAEDFYRAVLVEQANGKPMPLGEALRKVRAQWKEKKSLTYLGYVLYGDPTTVLSWK